VSALLAVSRLRLLREVQMLSTPEDALPKYINRRGWCKDLTRIVSLLTFVFWLQIVMLSLAIVHLVHDGHPRFSATPNLVITLGGLAIAGGTGP